MRRGNSVSDSSCLTYRHQGFASHYAHHPKMQGASISYTEYLSKTTRIVYVLSSSISCSFETTPFLSAKRSNLFTWTYVLADGASFVARWLLDCVLNYFCFSSPLAYLLNPLVVCLSARSFLSADGSVFSYHIGESFICSCLWKNVSLPANIVRIIAW